MSSYSNFPSQQYMHVAPQLSVGTTYKQDAVQPRGVSMIMSSDSATAVPYGMVPQFSALQIGSPVMNEEISLAIMSMIQQFLPLFLFSFLKQYISPPYPYYPPSIIHTMQMGDTEQVSNAASPDEAYTQYQHAPK
jgi:hypothetical protein